VTFVVETFWPSATEGAVRAASDRVRQSARTLSGQGVEIRLVGATWIPRDEALQCRFKAATEQAVRAAHALAEVRIDRLVRAVEIEQ
jgi:hypothetical protein